MDKTSYHKMIDQMVWSYSRLHTYRTCPASFKMLYIDKCEKAQNAFAEFGSLCHSILEDYENGILAEYELVDAYQDRWNDAITTEFPVMKGKSLGDRYYEDGLSYFSSFNGYPRNWEFIGAELEVKMRISGYRFTGYIDLLVRDRNDGKMILIDHKSKKGFRNQKERDEYAIQLYLYSIWVKRKYKAFPKELVFNMFRQNTLEVIPFNEEDCNAAKQWMLDTIESIKNDVDFWDKILLEYEEKGKDIEEYNFYDFFCRNICSCRVVCERSGLL